MARPQQILVPSDFSGWSESRGSFLSRTRMLDAATMGLGPSERSEAPHDYAEGRARRYRFWRGIGYRSHLTYGRDLARTFGARLHVLHVVDDVHARGINAEGYAVDFAEIQRGSENAARTQLEATVGDDDRRELRAHAVLRTSASPAAAIVSYAKEAGIDVVVIGTHGRGGMAHLFTGSVAERVVRTAPCPVLTVRHPEHEFVHPDALQPVTRS